MTLGTAGAVGAALAFCVMVWSYGLFREARHPTGHTIRWFRMLAGLSLMLVAVAGGTFVTRSHESKMVAPRGYGVVIEGVEASERRKFDIGLALAQSVQVTSCDPKDRATVTLQIAPTAEFWIDHLDTLRKRTQVAILIPNKSAIVQQVTYGEYGVDPFTRPVDGSTTDESGADESGADVASTTDEKEVDFRSSEVGADLRVDFSVRGWSLTREPLRITFTAPVVARRGLGTCYIDLPALTGLPTAISGASLENLAEPSITELEDARRQGLFIVSSGAATPQFAYYDPRFEITRGVTALSLQEGLVEDESQPAPDANFSGAPAWTCRSKVARELRVLEDEAAKDPPVKGQRDTDDSFFAISTTQGGTYALSGDRIDEVLEQKDCAARVKINAPSSGYSRDVLFLFVGALFSTGAALLTSSVRRRRSALASERGTTKGAPSAATGNPPNLLATARRMRATRRDPRRHHP